MTAVCLWLDNVAVSRLWTVGCLSHKPMAWGFPTLATSLVFQQYDTSCVQKLNFN